MKVISIVFFSLLFHVALSQDNGFPFGKVTYRELELKSYDRDTAAAAVIINEFGDAYIDNGDNHNLVLEYHVKIKILSKKGLEYANVEIPLYKDRDRGMIELVMNVKASSFNVESGSMKEIRLDSKNIFTENVNKFWDVTKFAIPNVRVGSVIEYEYRLESTLKFNFRTWEFQSDIPKMFSEYWATIPANYKYNISLKGFLPLSKNESELLKECFTPGGGDKADCARYKWAMKDIPAFIEEDYMTAKSNFLSTINFELSEIEYFDGHKDKYTKEWKDAELDLRQNENFGLQLKRGQGVMEDHIKVLLSGESEPLTKAEKIYDFIKGWYRWNENYGKYSEFGIKKAFEKKLGNVGDINLSLIAALKYADLEVEPMILSTRSNGSATELHPVLSDFNYVVAKLNINGKSYLLDATDDFMPFGLIPDRCLNGKGRVFGEDGSYWHEIKPADKARQLSIITLKLDDDGMFHGSLQLTYSGYDGVSERKKISRFSSEKEYIDAFMEKLSSIAITKYQLENVDDLKKPLVVKLDVEMEGYSDLKAGNFLFNPFILERWEENPFKSSERLYPVDFGAPKEEVIIFNLEYPQQFDPKELPSKVGLALPNAGGRYLFDIQKTGNKLTMNSSLLIARTVFTSEEYHYLKELFNRVVAVQQTDLVFSRN